MKTYVYVILITILAFFMSCSDNDVSTQSPKQVQKKVVKRQFDTTFDNVKYQKICCSLLNDYDHLYEYKYTEGRKAIYLKYFIQHTSTMLSQIDTQLTTLHKYRAIEDMVLISDVISAKGLDRTLYDSYDQICQKTDKLIKSLRKDRNALEVFHALRKIFNERENGIYLSSSLFNILATAKAESEKEALGMFERKEYLLSDKNYDLHMEWYSQLLKNRELGQKCYLYQIEVSEWDYDNEGGISYAEMIHYLMTNGSPDVSQKAERLIMESINQSRNTSYMYRFVEMEPWYDSVSQLSRNIQTRMSELIYLDLEKIQSKKQYRNYKGLAGKSPDFIFGHYWQCPGDNSYGCIDTSIFVRVIHRIHDLRAKYDKDYYLDSEHYTHENRNRCEEGDYWRAYNANKASAKKKTAV